MPDNSGKPKEIYGEAELAAYLRNSVGSENIASATLRTDDRVIARVTDGIYRQPGSALRELISNAYDADATRVVIKTDAPRFDRIVVEDNGHGMTPEMVARLLFHIGGSAKRNEEGKGFGITAADDPLRSPNGRRLIGKIGIGLFSVSQLTHSFQIITKVKGDSFRTVATVALKQYQDDDEVDVDESGKRKFESGKVHIWREKAIDVDAHGTSVILTSIRPPAKDTLRSREIWGVIEQNEASDDPDEQQAIEPPRFHIGRVDASGNLRRKSGAAYNSLPWDKSDSPDIAFRKLVDAVWNEVGSSNPNPQLSQIFDYYLRMVWQLALAVPVPYVSGHLFDMVLGEWAETFELSNSPKGTAKKLEARKETIRQALALKDPAGIDEKFEVYFDDLKLLRPIRFSDLPPTQHVLKKPLIFLGRCREEFANVPRAMSGGPLAFEAYLFWTPKIAPTEHQGSLIRIHGSSGTLFDPTFMRYQIAERTRLAQITCEIFVTEGLDSALNIDRESFNNAHPHSVYLTKWLHGAVRQLASTQKKVASEIRNQVRDEQKGVTVSDIQRIAIEAWNQESGDQYTEPPTVMLSNALEPKPAAEAYAFQRSAIVPERTAANTAKQRAREAILDEKLKAIAQVLISFGILESLSKRRQEKLLRAIYRILDASDE